MKRYTLKYCGNRSLEDLQMTVKSSADYIGVIFAQSKRQVKVETLKGWLEQISLKEKKLVGVFVNARKEEIKHVVSEIPLRVIQCHGCETREELLALKQEFTIPIWKAIHHSEEGVMTMRKYAGAVDGFVIDSKVKGAWGGTGKAFDWSFVPAYLNEAKRQKVPCFIAGGIHAGNIDELLRYNPDGIDLASGIEINEQKAETEIKKIEERVSIHDRIPRC